MCSIECNTSIVKNKFHFNNVQNVTVHLDVTRRILWVQDNLLGFKLAALTQKVFFPPNSGYCHHNNVAALDVLSLPRPLFPAQTHISPLYQMHANQMSYNGIGCLYLAHKSDEDVLYKQSGVDSRKHPKILISVTNEILNAYAACD